MKTVRIQKSNNNASPLVASESIYDAPALFASSKSVGPWVYNNNEIELPFSVNATDGQTSNYAKGDFNFYSTITIHKIQPTYLWFEHADHKATIYINNTQVEIHWGGYTSFFIDITNYITIGTNNIRITLKNNNGNYLAPASADFNFNATLGIVKLLTSPVLPSTNYGYDGFHVTSVVSSSSATLTIKTTMPTYADVVCKINDEEFSYVERKFGKGDIIFTVNIDNPHLWNGTIDPHLYDITLEIYYNEELHLKLKRPYGLRYYSYVFNDDTIDGYDSNNPYTGFLLNGSPYLLRGVCMHNDLVNKANALTAADMDNDFDIITELGANFIRTAHYPHPKQFYDYCDRLGIVVQTEVPCVNCIQATMPDEYYERLSGQYIDMVNQHYNHPCIFFWGLSNEAKTGDKKDENDNVIVNGKEFARQKCNEYTALIKSLDPYRWVGYVSHQGAGHPSSYFNNPDCDWFGGNIYVGWYDQPNSNTPTSQITTRLNTSASLGKPFAYSEYGCGGNIYCHSEEPLTTTTRGNNPRHDIEYQMWLHEGNITTIKSFPQLLFTSQWVLFDFAVQSRNEGYKVCLDGETVTDDPSFARLNDKGLVMRDHQTKKDTFYLYKAWWNPTPFVHICQKNYLKLTSRVIKCYTNDTGTFSLYVNPTGENDTPVATATATNNIVTFTAQDFIANDVIKVTGSTSEDSFIIAETSSE